MNSKLIIIEEYAKQSQTDIAFINLLCDSGLIEITIIDNRRYVEPRQLPLLEKFTRLHYDLQINIEGLEAIHHLLQRVSALQNEVTRLKNSLRFYEHL